MSGPAAETNQDVRLVDIDYGFFSYSLLIYVARSYIQQSDILPYKIKIIFQYPEILMSLCSHTHTEHFEDEGSNRYLHRW